MEGGGLYLLFVPLYRKARDTLNVFLCSTEKVNDGDESEGRNPFTFLTSFFCI